MKTIKNELKMRKTSSYESKLEGCERDEVRDEVKDITAIPLSYACKDLELEPFLLKRNKR